MVLYLVRAILKAQKGQFLKYAQDVFMENPQKSFEPPKGCLSCSENASEEPIQGAVPHGSSFFERN